jgi:hypothetical protein
MAFDRALHRRPPLDLTVAVMPVAGYLFDEGVFTSSCTRM